MNPKYYLMHSVVDPKPEKIKKILEDGYLYASSYSNQSGSQKHYHVSSNIPTGISGIPLDYVHLTLVGDVCSFCCG